MSIESGSVEEAKAGLNAIFATHEDCPWEQVGPCVYCTTHGLRLYQGDLPDRKRTIPKCPEGQHRWDPEQGLGFYFICEVCGVKEWPDE